MTVPELLGSATGGAALLKALDLGIAWARRRTLAAELPEPQDIPMRSGPKRSYSPSGGTEAVRAITDQRVEAATANATHTALLERIADAVERIPETLSDHKDAIMADVQKTRHGIRSDLQTLRLDMAGMVCRADGPPQPPQRGRLPSRPGGE